jgi:hypothetical protein
MTIDLSPEGRANLRATGSRYTLGLLDALEAAERTSFKVLAEIQRDMLKRLEWVLGEGGEYCAICDAEKEWGHHQPDCELSKILEGK